jgi:hypothetical protein
MSLGEAFAGARAIFMKLGSGGGSGSTDVTGTVSALCLIGVGRLAAASLVHWRWNGKLHININ